MNIHSLWKHKRFRVTVLFFLWVFFTGTAALYSKAYLNVQQMPYLLTMAQGFIGLTLNYLYLKWRHGTIQPLSGNLIDVLLVLSSHLVGTTMTNYATLLVHASFVNTLKASEPLCAVFLAKFVLNEQMTPLTYVSLVIIVVGVILACTTEFDFEWFGFLYAMGSNLFFTTRATFTKKLIAKDKSLNSQTIFLYISGITCLFTAIPAAWEIYTHDQTNDEAFNLLILAIVSHYLYNILGFFLVVEVDALTYSVGNSVKRLVTIYSAVLYFQNPVTPLNMMASVVAVGGVFLYSYDRDRVVRRVDNPRSNFINIV